MTTGEIIIDFLTGDLPSDAVADFEADLFAGNFDGPDLSELSEVTVALREAAFIGILSISVSREEMENVRRLGYQILECRLRPGEDTVLNLTADFDLIFLEYEIDLNGVEHLDCEVCDHEGNPFKRNVDIPVQAGQQVLSGFCARELAIAGHEHNPQGIITRFISVEPDGDRIIAEYMGRAIAPTPE